MTDYVGILALSCPVLPLAGGSANLSLQPDPSAIELLEAPEEVLGTKGGTGLVALQAQVRQGAFYPCFDGLLFERIIVLPRTVDVGYVLDDMTWDVEVWNSHRHEAAALTALAVSGSGGLVVTGSTSGIFQPSASELYTATLPAGGAAVIADVATWTFTGESGADHAATGSRVTVFPHRPDWSENFVERIGFLTDLHEAYDGNEQRRALRTVPRYVLSFRAVPTDPLETAAMEALLYGWQAKEFGVPVWPESTSLLTALSPGDAVVVADTTLRGHFVDGGLALIWTSWNAWEACLVDTVAAGGLTLSAGVRAAWAVGARVIPVRRAHLPASQALSRPVNWISAGRFEFHCEAV